ARPGSGVGHDQGAEPGECASNLDQVIELTVQSVQAVLETAFFIVLNRGLAFSLELEGIKKSPVRRRAR
ncbi:hypothetical protein, partial [Alcaligenes faecalis]|uniref:hypothetical protein n=1 Tax=Alcaligenes faecalis TaxID=511 RepID=UPI00203E43DE